MISKSAAIAALAAGIGLLPARALVPSPAGIHARTEIVLYDFAGGSDGTYPYAGVIEDQSGNLFGTTIEGGAACRSSKGCGTVFKLAPDGTESVLYAFRGGRDGSKPSSTLIADQENNLYGTSGGGIKNSGTVFEVTQGGVHTVLYAFTGGSDGAGPGAGVIADSSGNLYGTTAQGGSSNHGTVFKVSPAGVHTVLYSFSVGDGWYPLSQLTSDAAGDFFGTTYWGGNTGCSNGCGTVFKLALDGTETVLYAFRGRNDGSSPGEGALIFDGSGNLYGTAGSGGGSGCGGSGCGTVFEIAPDGTEIVLSRFDHVGGHPAGGLVLDKSGNLFGTTIDGGAAGCGTVFKITPGHEAKAIYSFTCGKDGGVLNGGLLKGVNGQLYGTTERGGNGNSGVVFAIQK
jgi:uncharacterized repeat protein (TIGR03803 family)